MDGRVTYAEIPSLVTELAGESWPPAWIFPLSSNPNLRTASSKIISHLGMGYTCGTAAHTKVAGKMVRPRKMGAHPVHSPKSGTSIRFDP